MQRRRGGGHEGAGLETPQELLVVATQPLLLGALLLNGIMEVGILFGQLPAGNNAAFHFPFFKSPFFMNTSAVFCLYP